MLACDLASSQPAAGVSIILALRMMDSKIFLDMIELTKGTGGDCDAYSSHCRFVQNSKDDGSPQPGEAMDRTAESPRPDKLIPSQSHPMLQIAFTESARYARSVSQSPPCFQKCMTRAPVSPCAPPRVFRGKASSWGHGEISRIHEPCRADEAARIRRQRHRTRSAAIHGSRGCLILREVQDRYWPYGVD